MSPDVRPPRARASNALLEAGLARAARRSADGRQRKPRRHRDPAPRAARRGPRSCRRSDGSSAPRSSLKRPRLGAGSSICRRGASRRRRCRRRGSSGRCWICDVARPVPTTAGRPYSRQTIAACDITPPTSVTVALIFEKIGAHAGEVLPQTRISPVADVGDLARPTGPRARAPRRCPARRRRR